MAIGPDRVAVLEEGEAVNYRMFGARGDGQSDDGQAIRRAHDYANRRGLPVVNLSGEFWITETTGILIQTPVSWGATVFHIDERYNRRNAPRFVVRGRREAVVLTADEAVKAALLRDLRPGVQIIPALAPYAGHLFSVLDDKDRIGIRAGYAGNRGWAREELFYVEEEGRIIGDIAWAFNDLTAITATPCEDTYLVISGGGFRFSGDSPENSQPGYHQHGIAVQRSRTVIREQWMGLEEGRRDVSIEPRSGFYTLNRVYDVTLENIRAMPWEKGRPAPQTPVQHGTYGIGGARMLQCTFRNLTAEAGWVAWGVFGTNLNKDFRLERCRLNRVDVHFHCWNLDIVDCTIGFKGISVTGGGTLRIENTVRHGNTFVAFRPDYGAHWQGDIRLRGCTLKPNAASPAAVLSLRPRDVDYAYPIGVARSIRIEDLRIDYSAVPANTAPCWLLDLAPFSRISSTGERLFFPDRVVFRDIAVAGRAAGVRLFRAPAPEHYDPGRDGGCTPGGFEANSDILVERVQLEPLRPRQPGDADQAHLVIGRGTTPLEYAADRALHPRLRVVDCDDVVVALGGAIAAASFERCGINSITAAGLRGELSFTACRFRPDLAAAFEGDAFALDSSLGTRFTACTVQVPRVEGVPSPDRLDRLGFLQLNGAVRHSHLHTALGLDILEHCQAQGLRLTPEFLDRLRSSVPAMEAAPAAPTTP
ncbi:MAG: hypothetical protein GX595_01545 [Lentisphaerae bacterium]|nr:hypothetical protein [Lentisphaerota bacterium]